MLGAAFEPQLRVPHPAWPEHMVLRNRSPLREMDIPAEAYGVLEGDMSPERDDDDADDDAESEWDSDDDEQVWRGRRPNRAGSPVRPETLRYATTIVRDDVFGELLLHLLQACIDMITDDRVTTNMILLEDPFLSREENGEAFDGMLSCLNLHLLQWLRCNQSYTEIPTGCQTTIL
jgi:hypothetical protein